MITKNMITSGYKAGLITIVDSPNGDGAVCEIGDVWFYFGGATAEEHTSEEYKKFVPEEDIVDEIFSVLEDFKESGEEFADEYLYYELFLRERGLREAAQGVYMKYALYGEYADCDMKLIKRDLILNEAIELSNKHYQETGKTAVIVEQQ